MTKGSNTRTTILKSAMEYVCQYGLTTLSIGAVAKRTGMSRTGVISHFANKADMQIAILQHCEKVFIEEVIEPAVVQDPLRHLVQFHQGWMNWVYRLTGQSQMSCPFVKAVAEFQDRDDDEVRRLIQAQQAKTLAYLGNLVEACMQQGVFDDNQDPAQFALASYSFYLGHNISKRLLNDPQADQRFIAQIDSLINQYSVKE